MDRRVFLKNLPFVGLFFYKIQKGLASAVSSYLLQTDLAGKINQIVLQQDNKPPVKLSLWWNEDEGYISTNELAGALDFHTYFNDTKKKIVLYLPQNQVVVTANNSFVIIDKDVFQMPAPAAWQKGEIFVPVKYFLPLINRHTSLRLAYNPDDNTVEVTKTEFNIAGVSIDSKENGTVIRIQTAKDFRQDEITADMRYGWLHVDIYGGKADAESIKETAPAGLVERVKTFQFAQLASLAFYLSKAPLSKEIIAKPESNEILVVLRTKENLSEDEMAELREEESREPSDETQKQLEAERRKWLIDVVVIDPGHGGKDGGAQGTDKKTNEKDIVLAIALKLGTLIKKELPDVKVVYTRDTDVFIPLERRTEIANQHNGKVFISIHANSVKNNSRVNGFETYLLGPEKGDRAREVVLKENSVIDFENASTRKKYQGINNILATMAQNAFMKHSEYLASLVQQNLNKELRSLKLSDRGIKQGPFWVMVGATMPNILVETGFLTNAYNLKILKTASYQYKIAAGIFEGLKQFKRDYESAI